MPYPRRPATKSLFSHHEDSRENFPDHYLIAHSDGGAGIAARPAVAVGDQVVRGRIFAAIFADRE